MPDPLVSIIVPVYNAEESLRQAIDSVLGQTYPHIEVVVVDDGSCDGSSEICLAYGDRIRCLTQANQGASVARNHGIRVARGDYIGFLDSDDCYLPDKVDKLVGLFEKYPEAGAVTGAFIEKTAGGARVTPEAGRVLEDGAEHGLINYFKCEYQGCWVVHTNTILVRRAVLEEVGGFDENMCFGEDVDLWSRIAGRYPVAYLDEPLAVYDRTNDRSLCYSASVLDHGVDFLYGRREEKEYIDLPLRPSYRLFRNKILLARLMLSIYEKNRRTLWACLRKFHPIPLNIRILLAIAMLPLPTVCWPRNRGA